MTEHRAPPLVVVPAFNEREAIGAVLADLHRELPEAEVLVVDDGSADDTALTARRLAPPGQRLRVVRLATNLGIGGAVQLGLRYAVRHGAEAVVQVDGDGQHPAAEARRVLARLNEGAADVVVGSRFVDGSDGFASSAPRRAGIGVLAGAIRLLGGPPVRDVTSGLRAYNRRAALLLENRYPPDYPEPEALLILGRAGLRVEEMPVRMAPRAHGRSSISPLASVFYMSRVLLGLVMLRVGRLPPAAPEVPRR